MYHFCVNIQVLNPETADVVFSTDKPSFTVPRGVKNINVVKAQTARIVSPTNNNLNIRADSSVSAKHTLMKLKNITR